jgi:hypothetical protein
MNSTGFHGIPSLKTPLFMITAERSSNQTCINLVQGNIQYQVFQGVGIETGYGLDGQVSVPGRGNTFPLHTVQTGSGSHPPSYPKGTGRFSSEDKAAGM